MHPKKVSQGFEQIAVFWWESVKRKQRFGGGRGEVWSSEMFLFFKASKTFKNKTHTHTHNLVEVDYLSIRDDSTLFSKEFIIAHSPATVALTAVSVSMDVHCPLELTPIVIAI